MSKFKPRPLLPIVAAEQIHKAMRLRKVNATELAATLGLGKSRVSQMIRGANLTLDTLDDIAKAMNCRVHLTFYKAKAMTTPPPPDAARAAFEAHIRATEKAHERYLKTSPTGNYIWTNIIDQWQGFRAAYRLMAKDAERLEYVIEREALPAWQIHDQSWCYPEQKRWYETAREAIDAAMSAVKGEKG